MLRVHLPVDRAPAARGNHAKTIFSVAGNAP